MPTEFADYTSVEDFAQMPAWAKSQARDPKVTRALVSTSSTRSDLLRSLLKPRNLIHCYARPGYGLDPWLTRLLATLPEAFASVDISKIMHTLKLSHPGDIVDALLAFFKQDDADASEEQQASGESNAHEEPHEKKHYVLLLRLDRIKPATALHIIASLGAFVQQHTLIVNSARSPQARLVEASAPYTVLHLGESMLSYSLEDYEKLTTRWPAKPTALTIQETMRTFDNWPEPCLRTLCALADQIPETTYQDGIMPGTWSAGHQWISTFIYSLPIELLQILLTAHAQPVISPEGLDLCDPLDETKPNQKNSLDLKFFDSRRRSRSQALTKLCHHLILEQFTHPRLHFRWCSKSIQTVLRRITTEKRQLAHLRLRPPKSLKGASIALCQLYLEHDYIQEIIQLSEDCEDIEGLQYLIEQQPGRVIDYLRGACAHLQSNSPTWTNLLTLTNAHSTALQLYFQDVFYWGTHRGEIDETQNLEYDAQQILKNTPIRGLLDQLQHSRLALASGQLADGLIRLEQVFFSAMDERCFSVAAPSIALIGLVDFFCMNKRHLRKILQSLDHAEALSDPQTLLSMVDWTDICVTPLQILSSHGAAITKRILSRTSQDLAGQIPEEAYLFQTWISCLASLYRGSPKNAQLTCNNALTRIMTHFRLLQEHQKHASENHPQGKSRSSDLNLDLLRPWALSFAFLKLLNDLQSIGKPNAREAQNLLKQNEPYFLMVETSAERKDIWHTIMQIMRLFLRAMQTPSLDIIAQLEREVAEAKSLDFRLVSVYGAFLLSAAYWNADQEDEALEHFYEAVEFAQSNSMQDILTPLIDLLHPQIRRAKQQNKAILLISRALEKIERKNTQKNNRLEQLSKRELEILSFINKGMSNEDIADHLCRAKGTVKLHVHNIYKKLEIRNRVEAIQVYNQYTKND